MGPNVTRLVQRQTDGMRTPQETAVIQATLRARDRGELDRRQQMATSDVLARIAAVRDNMRDPLRNDTDEAIAAELLRRMG